MVATANLTPWIRRRRFRKLHSGLPVNVALGVSISGQSNAIGGGGSNGGALSTTQPFSNTRWNRTLSQLDPLVETTVETIASGLANWLTEQEQSPAPGRVSIIDNWAVGSTAYSGLAQGTANYNNGQAAMENALDAQGGQHRQVLCWVHGETDDINGVTEAQYRGFMEELQSDWETDMRARLGVTYPIPLILSQYSAWSQLGTNRARSPVALGQLRAAQLNPDRIYSSGPNYHLPVQVNGNDLHYTNIGERRLGEYMAKAIRNVVILGRRPVPLAISRAVAVGNTVTVDLTGGDGSAIVADTTNVRGRHTLGFEYTDGTASPAAIVSAAIQGRSVILTLNKDAAASGIVRYAMTAAREALAGPTGNGPAGNIRDSDPTPSRQGGENPLWNWLHHDERALDSFASQGVNPPAWANTQSARFESASQYIGVNEWNPLAGQTRATFAGWLRRDSAPGSEVSFFGKNLTALRLLDFRMTAARAIRIYLATNLSTVVNGITANGVFPAATWVHWVIVCELDNATNANRVLLYLNGVNTALTPPAAWPTAFVSGNEAELGIGATSNGGVPLNLCNMRDVAVWVGTAANSTQVSELYNGGVPRDPALASFGVPNNLWRLNGDFADYGSSPRHGIGYSGIGFQAVVP